MRYVKRSWGYYITLLDRKRFKVKLLRFKHGHSCSSQYHKGRNELWLFLTGGGHFELGDNGLAKIAGEYVNVPRGMLHRFTADDYTWVLEIQYGDKCDEADIVRTV